MTEELINKYRPKNLSQIYGQQEIVQSLQRALEDGTSHSFLFTGPSGCGKTTLARLVAKHHKARITEVDAGIYTGIDDMRELLYQLRHVPWDGENQCYILNEVQSLSIKAWDAFLMSLEEPPLWLYLCLTTTEPDKVPKTVSNRCIKYTVRELSDDEIINLLEAIRDAEGLDTPGDILELCARSSNGSPRLAISNFALCIGVNDLDSAIKLLEEHDKPAEAVELIRALIAGNGWDRVQPIYKRLGETNPESIRRVCEAYLHKAIIGTRDLTKARHLFELMDHFASPFDSKGQLDRAVGRILFAQEI